MNPYIILGISLIVGLIFAVIFEKIKVCAPSKAGAFQQGKNLHRESNKEM